ncbi:hypothetical protein FA13DRAFT_1735448 [Coprinellus micaceus]|uniref:Uncharacterized protein n=1 Tax=Coprinellus micaceus TaxID=71717 RepID=A0A4Y7T3V9_COPMI|nr:hypothetical protein FA13DRAFT_1735448 [Coprinellus micaceus]
MGSRLILHSLDAIRLRVYYPPTEDLHLVIVVRMAQTGRFPPVLSFPSDAPQHPHVPNLYLSLTIRIHFYMCRTPTLDLQLNTDDWNKKPTNAHKPPKRSTQTQLGVPA